MPLKRGGGKSIYLSKSPDIRSVLENKKTEKNRKKQKTKEKQKIESP